MDYSELKKAAKEKLNGEGYDVLLLVSMPSPAGTDPDNTTEYGLAYGGILAPLHLMPYVKEAYAEKNKEELVRWLALHGGQINFSFLCTPERYTKKWVKRQQKIAKAAGVFLSDENDALMLGLTLSPETDLIFSRENFPELYEKTEEALQAYLDGEIGLVMT